MENVFSLLFRLRDFSFLSVKEKKLRNIEKRRGRCSMEDF